MKKMKKLAIIIGSESDLAQCLGGLILLRDHPEITTNIFIRSQHRNALDLQQLLQEIVQQKYNAIIAGAGWANHLTGCVDAFLRYTLKDTGIPVIGVAFSDKDDDRHTQAAILSITEVPGTQVVFKDEKSNFIGSHGFWDACQFAISQELPKIKLPSPKEPRDFSLKQAIEVAKKLLNKE